MSIQIQAIIQAQNSIGFSNPSLNASTTVSTKKAPITAPTITTLSAVSSTSVSLVFSPLSLSSQTGNSPITSYQVYYQDISGSTIVVGPSGLSTTQTISGLT